MNIDIEFSRSLLAETRLAAKMAGVKIPKGIKAMRADHRQYFVEGDGGISEYVAAHNAYDAKQKVIERMIYAAQEKFHEQAKSWCLENLRVIQR